MIGILGSGKFFGMAAVAVRWSSCITAGVAPGAQCVGMNPGQREGGQRMVKGCILPVVRIVAHLAVLGKRLGLVIFCTIVLNLVTGDTFRLGIQYSPLVTGRALGDGRMPAG